MQSVSDGAMLALIKAWLQMAVEEVPCKGAVVPAFCLLVASDSGNSGHHDANAKTLSCKPGFTGRSAAPFQGAEGARALGLRPTISGTRCAFTVLGWDFQHLGEDDEVFIVVIFSKAFLSILALSVGAGKLMRTMQPSLPTVKPPPKEGTSLAQNLAATSRPVRAKSGNKLGLPEKAMAPSLELGKRPCRK
jgi:hypothetical protein